MFTECLLCARYCAARIENIISLLFSLKLNDVETEAQRGQRRCLVAEKGFKPTLALLLHRCSYWSHREAEFGRTHWPPFAPGVVAI